MGRTVADSLPSSQWVRKWTHLAKDSSKYPLDTESDSAYIPSIVSHTRPYPTLKHWRDARGLNQREAAALLGITQSEYSKLETGRRTPRPRRLKAIVEVTGVPPEVLLGIA